MDRVPIYQSARNLMCICIDRKEDGETEGRMYHRYTEKPQRFLTISGLLRGMESVFDGIGYPERSTRQRTFLTNEAETKEGRWEEAREAMSAHQLVQHSGEIATFIVHVRFRQYSTWQGDVIWAEKNKKCGFRSALELLKLMDGALADGEEERSAFYESV